MNPTPPGGLRPSSNSTPPGGLRPSSTAPLVVTPGDPRGVGPEVTAKALRRWTGPVVVIGDSAALAPWGLPEGTTVVDPGDEGEPVEVASIRLAVRACLEGRARGLVTGPISKARLAARGFVHPGHTELLGELCGVERPVMAFVGGRVRVALCTVHVPLRRVPEVLTTDLVLHTIRAAHGALRDRPRLAVCGPNPHAGDGGVLGDEDERVVAPAVRAAVAEGLDARGPMSAETAFRLAVRGNVDWVVAAYHDQGLAPLKALDAALGAYAVNWTLGLPIVRTSVDHGTADDIAGKGVADEGSLLAALALADSLAQ